MEYRIVKQVVTVSKEEYIEHWEEGLKEMKANLKKFRIKTTKEINERIKFITKIEEELMELKK